MAYVGDELWFVNTRFSCLATHDPDHSFAPVWRPKFISQLTPDDRCHLNGLGLVDGRPRWVTALGETDTAGGWRENKKSGGILIDIESNEIVARGLSMPHSPRWHAGRLWLLGIGHRQPGLRRPGHAAGTSRSCISTASRAAWKWSATWRSSACRKSAKRPSSAASKSPSGCKETERTCGVWVVDIQRGQVVAFLKFEEAVQEIFAVALLPGMRFPDLINDNAELVGSSFVLPDDGAARRAGRTAQLRADCGKPGIAAPPVACNAGRTVIQWLARNADNCLRSIIISHLRRTSHDIVAVIARRSLCRRFMCLADRCRKLATDHAASTTASKLRALIIDGQNNHDWKTTTPLLQEGAGIERPVHGRRRHVAAGAGRHERLPAEVRRLRRRRQQLQRRPLAEPRRRRISKRTSRAAADSSPSTRPTTRSPIGPSTTA